MTQTTVNDAGQATAATAASPEAFGERLFEAILGAADIFSIHIGLEAGYYAALADGGPATSTDLAARTGTHERYVREWLEQQAATGILEVDDASADALARRFTLPPGHAEPLLDGDSLNFIAPFFTLVMELPGLMPRLLQAHREGGGVAYSEYGERVVRAQALMNRPLYLQVLAQHWLPAIDDVHARLQADPPARVADIGCGAAWSSIAIASAYPAVEVEAFDVDETSVRLAAENVREAGLDDRISVHEQDVTDPAFVGRYDLIFAGEMLHDLARPVEALQAMRRIVAEDGVVLVLDEAAADEFAAPASPVERLLYAGSNFVCLPNGMAEQPSAGTGTVMRRSTLERYAREAGFARVEVVPIEHPMLRLYRLHA